jgi:hypothetical protein
MTCEYCEKGGGTFNLYCDGCKNRLVMGQPCKIVRKQMAEDIEARWGFLPDYQREPHCGCEKFCKFKQRIKQKHEQPLEPARTKAPRRR